MTSEEKAKMGRPPLPDDMRRDETIRVRSTAEEKAQFEAVGGAEWFRSALAAAYRRLMNKK